MKLIFNFLMLSITMSSTIFAGGKENIDPTQPSILPHGSHTITLPPASNILLPPKDEDFFTVGEKRLLPPVQEEHKEDRDPPTKRVPSFYMGRTQLQQQKLLDTLYQQGALTLNDDSTYGIHIKDRVNAPPICEVIDSISSYSGYILSPDRRPIDPSKLKTLNLTSSHEVQQLPEHFGNFSNLKQLYIGQFSGETLPDSFSNLTHLEVLNIKSTTLANSSFLINDFQKLKSIYLPLSITEGVIPEITSTLKTIRQSTITVSGTFNYFYARRHCHLTHSSIRINGAAIQSPEDWYKVNVIKAKITLMNPQQSDYLISLDCKYWPTVQIERKITRTGTVLTIKTDGITNTAQLEADIRAVYADISESPQSTAELAKNRKKSARK